jgi:hypothetical protein
MIVRARMGRLRIRFAFGAVMASGALLCVLPAPPAAAAPGDLDPTFSRDGKRTIDLGTTSGAGHLHGQLRRPPLSCSASACRS